MSPTDAPSGPRSARGGGRRGRGGGGGGGGGGDSGAGRRGRGGGRGGRGGRGGGVSEASRTQQSPEDGGAVEAGGTLTPTAALKTNLPDDTEGEDCFICANKVVYYSITPCNHKTCHICDLRMRALYKSKNCLTCRTPVEFVIFTNDPEKPHSAYTDADISTTDLNLGIKYANEDIVGDTVLLLRYNCPEPTCDFAGLGWPNLHKHVRGTHHKRMCDLCTRNKKVFTHEHELLTDRELDKHMRRGDDRPGAADQTGFKGHPLCTFCGERFYDDDKLFEHCRVKHERCFLCDRRDSRQPHYYLDYDSLERHFKDDHFLCADRECLDKKFVVFDSEMDLKAHTLSEHGAAGAAGRDARRVDMSQFNFREPYQQVRRGGGRDARREEAAGPTPAQAQARTQAAQVAQAPAAQQRQVAVHSAQSVTSRTFGGQLSSTRTPPSSAAPTPAEASRRSTPQPQPPPPPAADDLSATASAPANLTIMTPEQRARALRHAAVIERASSLVAGDSAKLNSFRTLISRFRTSAISASTTLDSFFTLFSDASPNAISTLVRETADLFEDPAKADALRTALADWRSINEDYPSLPGLGGMQGSTTATSGWASAAAASPSQGAVAPDVRHSTRVLRLKSATRTTGGASASSSIAASLGSRPSAPPPPTLRDAFPALPAAPRPAPAIGPLPTRSNWATSSPSPTPAGATPSSSSSTPAPVPRTRPPPAVSSGADFPALPEGKKPQLTIWGPNGGRPLRREQARDTGFSWGGKGGEDGGDGEVEGEGGEQKRGKGKKKTMLLHWG